MNNWDTLSTKFNVHKKEEEIDPEAADNILLAWPPIVSLITQHFNSSKNQNLIALDYGCGTGGFANKLNSLGFVVTGADESEGMLQLARQSVDKNITLLNSKDIPHDSHYDLISGIMVFQFVEDIEEAFKQLVARLNKGGLIVFAVFNPRFISTCLQAQVLFSHFDSLENPKVGLMDFSKDIHIPTYIRTAAEYDKLMKELGLTKLLEIYPPFTEEFLKQYAWDLPANEPEYLILGYAL